MFGAMGVDGSRTPGWGSQRDDMGASDRHNFYDQWFKRKQIVIGSRRGGAQSNTMGNGGYDGGFGGRRQARGGVDLQSLMYSQDADERSISIRCTSTGTRKRRTRDWSLVQRTSEQRWSAHTHPVVQPKKDAVVICIQS